MYFPLLTSKVLIFCFLMIFYSTEIYAQQSQKVYPNSHNMQLNQNIDQLPQQIENHIKSPAPKIPIGEDILITIKKPSDQFSTASILSNDTIILNEQNTSQKKIYQTSSDCTVNIASGSAPSDIHGAVGINNMVVVTNRKIGVYNKSTCEKISYESLNTFFSSQDTSSQYLFDPRVIYDLKNNRFLVTAESYNGNSNDQYQYIAISKDNSGTNWWYYKLKLSEGDTKWCKQTVDSFWDYPAVGYDDSNWYITANDFGTKVTGAIISIDKSDTMQGSAILAQCFNNLSSNLQPSIVIDSSIETYFISPGSGRGNSIKRYKFIPTGNDGKGTLNNPVSVSIPSWEAAPNAKQPNGQKLDSLDGRFQSASIQIRSSIWNIHTIKYNNVAELRLYKIPADATEVSFYRTFTTGGTEPYLFNPSIAVTPKGHIYINSSRTTTTTNASMIIIEGDTSSSAYWFYSTIATSPSQFLTDGYGNYCNDTSRQCCRWGDYSSMQVDPKNLEKGWGFNQLADDTLYGQNQFGWTTHVGTTTKSSSSNQTSFLPSIYYILY